MIRYLSVSALTFLLIQAPAWADDDISDAGRYQVISGAQMTDRNGKPRPQTILLDTATGRTWTLAPDATSDAARRLTWLPIPVQSFDSQQALAGPGSENAKARRQDTRNRDKRQGEGYRERLWNYERDP